MNGNVGKILEMLHVAEQLKQELRHSWLANGRQESSAEHSWRLALMVLLMGPETKLEMDLPKALKMAVIHDLVEAEAYDIPAFEHGRAEEKRRAESAAAVKYKSLLDSQAGDEIYNLWAEYEEQESVEAKFIKALDKLEVRIQHNEAQLDTWNEMEYPRSLFTADKFCEIDDFLKEFNIQVQGESRQKMTAAGKDMDGLEREALKMQRDD